MNIILLILTYLFQQPIGVRQKPTLHYQIDTLSTSHDSVFASYSTYENSIKSAEHQGYLYPTNNNIPRFYLLGRGYFSKTVNMVKIVFHKQSVECFKNGNKKVSEFSHGVLINQVCFDSAGNEISEEKCVGNINQRDGPLKGEVLLILKSP